MPGMIYAVRSGTGRSLRSYPFRLEIRNRIYEYALTDRGYHRCLSKRGAYAAVQVFDGDFGVSFIASSGRSPSISMRTASVPRYLC